MSVDSTPRKLKSSENRIKRGRQAMPSVVSDRERWGMRYVQLVRVFKPGWRGSLAAIAGTVHASRSCHLWEPDSPLVWSGCLPEDVPMRSRAYFGGQFRAACAAVVLGLGAALAAGTALAGPGSHGGGGFHGGGGGLHGGGHALGGSRFNHTFRGPGYGGWNGYRGGNSWHGWHGWHGGHGWWGWGGVGLGWWLPVLPLGYATYWWGGVPYYYADNSYFVWDDGVGQYEAVEPPPDLSASPDQAGVPPPGTPPANGAGAPPAGGPTSIPELFAYPKGGQSAEQQARDRQECQQWATSQTGVDPAKVPANPGQQMRRQDYLRAETSCLEGRNYSVQ